MFIGSSRREERVTIGERTRLLGSGVGEEKEIGKWEYVWGEVKCYAKVRFFHSLSLRGLKLIRIERMEIAYVTTRDSFRFDRVIVGTVYLQQGSREDC